MNYWIFQSTLERYPLRVNLIEEQNVTWFATRYRSLMLPGDVVFFWQAGSEEVRGLYGWGILTSKPRFMPERTAFGVDVVYKERFQDHISVGKIKSKPLLRELLILRIAIGTNFLITHQEAGEIIKMISPEQRPQGL